MQGFSQALQQAMAQVLQHFSAASVGQMGTSNRAVPDAVTKRGMGGHAGSRRRLGSRGMVLPRLEPKTTLEGWADSIRCYFRMASKERVLAEIREQFPDAEVEDFRQ